jgi:drug/metabolite transporter (DMT)-like permease
MTLHYLIGVVSGILGGILTQFGSLLEKWAVNRIRQENAEKGFMRRLIRNPIWLFGVVIGLGGGWVAYMISQTMIGPALTPGLMAGGLVVLAIGSVKMNKETLNASEMFGIGLMVLGIACLGLSGLGINSTQVKAMLASKAAQFRIFLFTVSLLILCLASRGLSRRIQNRKGMLIALGNGFLSCLSDFWINPLLALIVIIFAGYGNPTQFALFSVATLIFLLCAGLITWQTQEAFKYAQASNILPVSQVPIQIAPVLVYFVIFSLAPPNSLSVFYILAGTVLTIVSGFLLGRRAEAVTE